MTTTFFNLKNKTTSITDKQKQKTIKILLEKHEEPETKSVFTYIDSDGNSQTAFENLSKDENGSYFMSKTSIMHHPIYTIDEITYSNVQEHFSYKDKDGNDKVFNNLETLEYNEQTNTYTGLVEEIEYITETVEVFAKDEKN